MKEILRRKTRALKSGDLSEKDFLHFLENLPFSNDPHVKLDFHRKLRRGIPEVIFGQSKSVEQLRHIIRKFAEVGEDMLITRIDEERFRQLQKDFPDLRFHAAARIVTSDREPKAVNRGKILVLSAGASDERVAEEAFVTARYLGNRTDKEYDVGVACLARILSLQKKLSRYAVIIAVAGMEGALPSVVAGLTSTPIIAVPTSVGYGSSFGGLSALLSMLNSCAGGISVVNIDNGFGAAYQATLINRKISR
jgi:pyridinium-3,5-biscarboxylic acid mononucleotide synthase